MSARCSYDKAKRVMDFVVASIALLITAPAQAVIAVVVALRLGKPVIFRQERPGLRGQSFTLVKFRTMLEIDHDRSLVSDAERMTSLGRFLRSTSLDELPTLWNVVRGDMSLVGPRPLLPAYLELYSADEARRHEVRPGVTGLAQISGRNELVWAERFKLDVEYVDNRSIALDARILIATLKTVVCREGITGGTEETMTPFTGETLHDPKVRGS